MFGSRILVDAPLLNSDALGGHHTTMRRQSFWYAFVVPWIGFALFLAEFSPQWGTDAPYSRRLLPGLLGGFIFAAGTYLTSRITERFFRSCLRRKQVPPAALRGVEAGGVSKQPGCVH